MKRSTIAICVGLLLASAACGFTEGEASGLLDPTSVNCPTRPLLSFEEAASRAELVVHARPMESFFVDNCHRAFLLDVESVWQGELPDPVLAIIRIDPYGYVERWTDLGLGETAIFLLESDPEVPEAFRPVGRGAVIAVEDGLARICQSEQSFGCDEEPIALHTLRSIFHDSASDLEDHEVVDEAMFDVDDTGDPIEPTEEPVSPDAADIELEESSHHEESFDFAHPEDSHEARIDFADPEYIEARFVGHEG